jgi:hypothetical protein
VFDRIGFRLQFGDGVADPRNGSVCRPCNRDSRANAAIYYSFAQVWPRSAKGITDVGCLFRLIWGKIFGAVTD